MGTPVHGDRLSTETRNVCAGPFGAVYDYYIERPRLARLVLGLMWGVDPRPFYRSLAAVGEMPDGATILDVPCGGGVALRGLRPEQSVSWIGVDVEPAMLRRARCRAARFPTVQARLIEGDMTALPLEDCAADLYRASRSPARTVRVGNRQAIAGFDPDR
jgi:SAM-dependent methyltransferase